MSKTTEGESLLPGVRVLELTDEKGVLCGKMRRGPYDEVGKIFFSTER